MKNGTKPAVAVLGIGRMGSALAGAFLDEGYRTAVWNRTKTKSEPLGARGARIASTVLDAVETADVVVVNVNDYATTHRLLGPDDVTGALRGKLLVQLPSGSPRQAREMAAWARDHGILYLDGAIMGTPNVIGTPGGTVLYSGPRDLFEKYQPLLLALGGNARHVGSDVGHASALDSALLAGMWGTLFGTLQGVAICQAEELPLEAYTSYIEAFASTVDGAVKDLVARIDGRRFAGDEATLATIDTHYGALRHLADLCGERGIHRAIPDAFDQLFRKAIAAGHEQDDFAVLSTFMQSA